MSEEKTFEMRSVPIDVTRAMVPDRGWRYVDKKGHEHSWAKDETLPSLKWERTGWTYYSDGAKLPIGHYECRKCGEKIHPPLAPNNWREYIPGPIQYYIDGFLTDKETYELEFQLFKEKGEAEAKEKRRQQYLSLKEEFDGRK